MEFDKCIGLAVKELRTAKGLTQHQLAEKAGVYKSYFTNIELGKNSPSVSKLNDIALAMGTTLSNLIITAERIGKEEK